MKKLFKFKLKKFSPLMFILAIVLLVYVISLLYPLVWSFLTSLKSDYELQMSGYDYNKLPESLNFTNYATVFNGLKFKIDVIGSAQRDVYALEMLGYTMIYVLGCAFFATFTPFIVGYVTSRFSFKFNKVIYITVIISMTLPIVGSLPSELRMAKLLGFWNNPIGLWIMSMTYLSMYYLVFHAHFKGIPDAYAEAAQIDGASNLRVFLSVMMPMAKGTFFTVFLLHSIMYWNNYQTPLVYLPSYPTIAVGLYSFNFNAGTSDIFQTAAALMVSAPIVIIFSIFSNKIMGKASMGGLKE